MENKKFQKFLNLIIYNMIQIESTDVSYDHMYAEIPDQLFEYEISEFSKQDIQQGLFEYFKIWMQSMIEFYEEDIDTDDEEYKTTKHYNTSKKALAKLSFIKDQINKIME